MRPLVVTFLMATMLAGCGGAATPASSVPASAGATGPGAFVIAGLTANVDPLGPLDPSTFATSFTTNIPVGHAGSPAPPGIFLVGDEVAVRVGIYVVFQLAPGLAGKVGTVTTAPDGKTIADSLEYSASDPEADFSIVYDGGLALGDHQVVLTFEPTGESVTLTLYHHRIPASPAADACPDSGRNPGYRRVNAQRVRPSPLLRVPHRVRDPWRLRAVRCREPQRVHLDAPGPWPGPDLSDRFPQTGYGLLLREPFTQCRLRRRHGHVHRRGRQPRRTPGRGRIPGDQRSSAGQNGTSETSPSSSSNWNHP